MNRNLDTPRILSRSLGALVEHPLPFLTLALVFQSPRILLAALWTAAPAAPPDGEFPLLLLGWLFPMLLLSQLQAGFTAPAVRSLAAGGEARLWDCLRQGFRRWVALPLTAAVVAVVVSAGFLFFLLPGWIALTFLFVATPVLILEDVSLPAALKRSAQLVAGYGFSIFALIFLFTVMEALLTLALRWAQAPALSSALAVVPISALQAITATQAYLALASPPAAEAESTEGALPGETSDA
jgi:hypothetical protein